MRYTPHEEHVCEMHVYEVLSYDIHACEVHAHEVYAHETHAYEMHAYEMHAHYPHEVHAHKLHAYEAHAYEMHARKGLGKPLYLSLYKLLQMLSLFGSAHVSAVRPLHIGCLWYPVALFHFSLFRFVASVPMGLRTGLVTFARVQDKFHSIESIKTPPFISSSVIDRTPDSRDCGRQGTRTKAEEAQHKTLKQAILKEAQVSQNLLVRDP
jgi:hypothetical protein